MKKIFFILILIVFIITGVVCYKYKVNGYENKINEYQNKISEYEDKINEYENTIKKMEYNEIHIRNIVKGNGLRNYFNNAPPPVQKILDNPLVPGFIPALY